MKQYPERSDKELQLICECGHGRWNHEFHINLLFQCIHDECTKCMCPKYKFEKQMTMKEYVIYNERQKNGDMK